MLGSDLKHLKFFQFWVRLQVKRPVSVKLCQNTWGAVADWKDWVALPVISGRGLSCVAALGGHSSVEAKRHQVGCRELVGVGWVNTLSASRQMPQFLYFQWKIFRLQCFFSSISFILGIIMSEYCHKKASSHYMPPAPSVDIFQRKVLEFQLSVPVLQMSFTWSSSYSVQSLHTCFSLLIWFSIPWKEWTSSWWRHQDWLSCVHNTEEKQVLVSSHLFPSW